MKKFILLIAVLFVGMTAFAQRTISSDTVFKSNTVNFASMQDAKTVQAVVTAIGDSTAGTLALYGSLDGTNWTFLNYLNGTLGVASPKASLTGADLNQVTMSSGLVASWNINLSNDKFIYHRITAVGAATNDSTLVSIKWSK